MSTVEAIPQGDDDREQRARWMPLLFGAGVLLLLALAGWGLYGLLSKPAAPKRQVAKISILPDTPPPPPPKEEKKPEPKPEEKPVQQVDTPKPETPPEPQQIKMEGPAGEGPSPFAGGEVRSDYIGGDIGAGARFAAYTQRLSRTIQQELSRRNMRNGGGRVLLWLEPDGTVQRFRLIDVPAPETKALLETAFAELRRVTEPPPRDMPMPVGLEIRVQ